MATLVLTAVGTALGGPVGGALGSMIGQAIDTQIFGSGPRKGPRLDDLKVQTSSYGTPIPRLYGRMRVAGTVVWATDFKETEEIEGGGKGTPESIRYNYSASFAVVLSSRAIRRVGRIWADGKLIRGAEGDLKVQTRLRVHKGSEGQLEDPLISAIEGASGTPAYRGLALAVFEDLALAEFGNRIPVLTFEVVADDDDPEVGEVVCDASNRTILPAVPASTPSLIGYAAYGSDRRSAIEQLAELASIRFRERHGRIGLANGTAPMPLPATEDGGWSASGKLLPYRGEWRQEPTASLPATFAIRYHEPERDYQAGQMRATTPGGRGELTVDSATALTAVEAKRWAERALARRWVGRDRITLNLSSNWIGLAPGDQVELPWRDGRWTVEETTVEAFGVIVNCRREEDAGTSLSADPGRGLPQDDDPIGTSSIAVFDLPDLGFQTPDRPRLHVAVSSGDAFKPVPVATFIAGLPGPSLVVARRARLGRALTPLSPGEAWLFDASASLDVELVNPAQVLLNADDDALDGGANLAMAGSELLQFGRAVSLGSGRWRLSRLLRGRRGSEWAMASHAENEHFVMIDPASLVSIDLDQTKIGAAVEVTAHGIADDPAAPPSFSATANARALAPLAPCFLSGESREDGLHLKWMRRSIKQWGWGDGQVDDKSPVAFRVTIEGPADRIEGTVSETSLVLPWTALAAMGTTPISATVVELGGWRSSPPTTAHLSL